MLQVTVIRAFAILVTGIVLFFALLYFIGCSESRYLRKRRLSSVREPEGKKRRIAGLYLRALCAGILICFLIIKYWIRS